MKERQTKEVRRRKEGVRADEGRMDGGSKEEIKEGRNKGRKEDDGRKGRR